MTTQNETIDALILAAATAEWQKIALVISKVFDAPALANIDVPKDKLGQTIADRLYIIVDNGGLACQGNMRRWRDSDIKLTGA